MLLLVFMFYEKYTTGANQPLPRAADYPPLNTIKYRETDETREETEMSRQVRRNPS